MKKRKLKEEALVFLGFSSSFVVLFTWLGFLNSFDLFFDLVAHFRIQYLIASGVFSLVYLSLRRPIGATIMVLHALVNAFVVTPYFWPAKVPSETNGVMLRALLFNVHQENEQKEEVLSFIKRTKADVMVLVEVNEEWDEALKSLKEDYPYSLSVPRDDNFGIALLSKLPLIKSETKYLSVAGRPSTFVEVDLKFQKLTVLGMHPFPPLRRRLFELRNSIIGEAGELLRGVDGPKLVLGDLNTTPWTSVFSKFMKRARLRSALKGRFIWRTWPGNLPAIFGIPIDHCLVSEDIVVRGVRKGPWLNSDHAPIVCDLFVSVNGEFARY